MGVVLFRHPVCMMSFFSYEYKNGVNSGNFERPKPHKVYVTHNDFNAMFFSFEKKKVKDSIEYDQD